jgi:hypothetical protein
VARIADGPCALHRAGFNNKLSWVVAALAIVVLAWLVAGIAATAGSGGPHTSPSSPTGGKSSSYQTGYAFGVTVTNPNMVDTYEVCGAAFTSGSATDKGDYMQGCTDGIYRR